MGNNEACNAGNNSVGLFDHQLVKKVGQIFNLTQISIRFDIIGDSDTKGFKVISGLSCQIGGVSGYFGRVTNIL